MGLLKGADTPDGTDKLANVLKGNAVLPYIRRGNTVLPNIVGMQ